MTIRPILAALCLCLAAAMPHAAFAREDLANTRVTFAHAVKQAAPSVVNIYAAQILPDNRQMLANNPDYQHLLPSGPVTERIRRSLGSGVIVRDDGVVVTNLHVIQGADAVKVVLADGREFAATQIGHDDKLDLAVLRLQMPKNETVPAATFGNSETLQVGDVVLALGNPFGIGQSVSFGVVSAVERSAAALSPYARFIQTDAPINPGNSGGALIDSTGKVVGINSGIFSKSGTSNGIGFAIPSSMVERVVKDIVTTGRVIRPWFGAEGQQVSDSLARELGLRAGTGVFITNIIPGSPADVAGLRKGDVLLSLSGKTIPNPAALSEQIVAMPDLLNKQTAITYWRGGKVVKAYVTLTALPPRLTGQQLEVKGYNPLTGYTLEPLSPALNVEIGLPLSARGVAIVQAPDRPPLNAFKLTLLPGDVLTTINNIPVSTPQDVQVALASSRSSWDITYRRNGRTQQVHLQ